MAMPAPRSHRSASSFLLFSASPAKLLYIHSSFPSFFLLLLPPVPTSPAKTILTPRSHHSPSFFLPLSTSLAETTPAPRSPSFFFLFSTSLTKELRRRPHQRAATSFPFIPSHVEERDSAPSLHAGASNHSRFTSGSSLRLATSDSYGYYEVSSLLDPIVGLRRR
ncbi:hypothetical protein KM043_010086 [Ampulex compressa]|nr:hypothetical protein KM043_010086 [Ampulex compressa]